MNTSEQITVEMRLVSKSYGATVALEDVSLRICPGEIQALLGENGAGKSTLVKVLSGVVKPDTGSMSLDGQPFAPARLLDARNAGVSTAFQELSLAPNLSVAQNFFLPRSLKGRVGFSSIESMASATTQILAHHNAHDIDVTASLESL